MEKSCENQKEPKMTLLLKIHLIHFICRNNVNLAIVIFFPEKQDFWSHIVFVSNNFYMYFRHMNLF